MHCVYRSYHSQLTVCTYSHAHIADNSLGLWCLQQLCKDLEGMEKDVILKKVVCTAITPMEDGGREGRKEGERGREGWSKALDVEAR